MNRLKASLEQVGLRLNEAKCATMRIDIDGRRKVWIANAETFLMINENPVTALNIVTSYKYLGLRTGTSGSHADVKEALSTGLERIKRAPLKPQQRMFLLRTHLIPRMNHQLVLGEVTASTLECLDRMVTKAIREWLRLPKDTPKPYYHASPREGGLGVCSLRLNVAVLRKKRLLRLSESADEAIRWVASTPGHEKHVKKATRLSHRDGKEMVTTLECSQLQAVALHRTCDGKGLWQSNSCPSVNSWVTDGTSLLTGGDYIQAVQVRGNLLPSGERTTRGRREAPPMCEAGCNAVSSLGHISQSCTRTHRLRTSRHNSVVQFIDGALTKKGNTVLVEPVIPTCHGNRKPLLVIINETEAKIVDVTITADLFDMGNAYQQKVDYYNYRNEDVLRWVSEQFPGRVITNDAVVVNWRGAINSRSSRLLSEIGINLYDQKIIAVQVLTFTYSMFRHYSRSTTRI